MPKIKTRKALEESARQVHRLSQKQKEETTPESNATNKVETTVKYNAQDTARYLGRKLKQRNYTAPKKSKMKKPRDTVKSAQRTTHAAKVIGKAIVTGAKATAKVVAETGKAIASAIASTSACLVISNPINL